MSKVRYKIRIYAAHDLDLVTLIRNYNFNAVKALYCALNGMIKKDSFVIQIPEKREAPLKARKSFSKTLSLDTENDAELIEMLENIQSGYRNFFLKNVLRAYIGQPAFSEFFENNSENYESCIIHFKSGKRIVNAATIKGKKRSHLIPQQKSEQEKQIDFAEDNSKEQVTDKFDNTDIDTTKTNEIQDSNYSFDSENDELTDLFSSFFT